jgi:hypothetical protein
VQATPAAAAAAWIAPTCVRDTRSAAACDSSAAYDSSGQYEAMPV